MQISFLETICAFPTEKGYLTSRKKINITTPEYHNRCQEILHPLVRSLPRNVKKKNGPYTGPILLGQGEPGMSQYTANQ